MFRFKKYVPITSVGKKDFNINFFFSVHTLDI